MMQNDSWIRLFDRKLTSKDSLYRNPYVGEIKIFSSRLKVFNLNNVGFRQVPLAVKIHLLI